MGDLSRRLFPIAITVSLLLLVIIACGSSPPGQKQVTTRTFKTSSGIELNVEVVAKNLEVPWSIVFASENRIFVTERPGRVRVIENGRLRQEPMAVISEVEHTGEGGLMGLVLDPKFSENRFVYVSYTYRGAGLANKVVRYREEAGKLVDPYVIIDKIPGARFHDGCRIRFGPDGKLYVTTGDAVDRPLAQDMKSLAGKVLRLNPDGTIPPDNPFPGSPVYSLGHRNPQGIDWHPITGLIFSTEHGPSGFDGPGGGDEVNLVEVGKNYGWPVIHHRDAKEGMISPLLEFTPAIAPASGSFYRGNRIREFKNNFFFGALRGRHIHRVIMKAPDYRTVEFHEALLDGVFGRIRDVVEGPDGALYFCTSNRDGRAGPHEDDDRLLRIIAPK
jgi:glucose/arabinose dehydrogenase